MKIKRCEKLYQEYINSLAAKDQDYTKLGYLEWLENKFDEISEHIEKTMKELLKAGKELYTIHNNGFITVHKKRISEIEKRKILSVCMLLKFINNKNYDVIAEPEYTCQSYCENCIPRLPRGIENDLEKMTITIIKKELLK